MSDTLKRLRKERRISQAAMADAMGISQSRYNRGEKEMAEAIRKFKKTAAALNMTPLRLFAELSGEAEHLDSTEQDRARRQDLLAPVCGVIEDELFRRATFLRGKHFFIAVEAGLDVAMEFNLTQEDFKNGTALRHFKPALSALLKNSDAPRPRPAERKTKPA